MRGAPALALLVAAGLLAGCTTLDDPSTRTMSSAGATQSATGEPGYLVLAAVDWNFTNQAPQPLARDVPVTSFDIAGNFSRLDVRFQALESPPFEVFADNGRAYGPNGTFDQGAFNASGVVALSFDHPLRGHWDLTFVTDQAYPQGHHRLYVTAIVTL
jgi:hypothetical protein